MTAGCWFNTDTAQPFAETLFPADGRSVSSERGSNIDTRLATRAKRASERSEDEASDCQIRIVAIQTLAALVFLATLVTLVVISMSILVEPKHLVQTENQPDI